ncbi:hypothetical protein E3P91_03879 [Wallemia ichthyophaga]|nr:hypothetical protein E3P91_03879 [Wallemia ichthyophaga]TIB58507.1 hypothetical protein E3P78_03887 [Wallemia ichthyophaga]
MFQSVQLPAKANLLSPKSGNGHFKPLRDEKTSNIEATKSKGRHWKDILRDMRSFLAIEDNYGSTYAYDVRPSSIAPGRCH